jgi:hypothetical protein
LARHRPPKALVIIQSLYGWTIQQHHDILLEHFMRPDLAWSLWSRGLFTPLEAAEGLVSRPLASLAYRRHINRLRTTGHLADALLHDNAAQYDDPNLGHVPVLRVLTQMDELANEIHLVMDQLAVIGEIPEKGLSREAGLLVGDVCSRARAAGIPAIVMIAPTPSPILANTASLEGLTTLERQIRAAAEPGGGCRVTNTIDYSVNMFGDGVHLNQSGATLFSRLLAEFVRDDIVSR